MKGVQNSYFEIHLQANPARRLDFHTQQKRISEYNNGN